MGFYVGWKNRRQLGIKEFSPNSSVICDIWYVGIYVGLVYRPQFRRAHRRFIKSISARTYRNNPDPLVLGILWANIWGRQYTWQGGGGASNQ